MLNLDTARQIIRDALDHGRTLELKPLSVIVLDPGGFPIAFEREDGASNLRFKMAHAKANGALCLGMGSRSIFNRALEQPFFTNAISVMADGAVLPVPGGVLVLDGDGNIVGAVGITGDTSDNDEACAIHAIEKASFTADAG